MKNSRTHTYRVQALLMALTLALTAILAPLHATAQDAALKLALTPQNAQAKAQSKQLLEQEFKVVQEQAQAQAQAGPRLWYAGFGFDSGTGAFRGDVDLTEKRIKAINPNILSYKLDNQVQTRELDRPFAHLGSFQATFKHLGQQLRDQDFVVVLLSSHGNVGYIANQIGSRRYGDIAAHHIKTVLQNLKDTPTIIIISACFSGSLIPSLEAPNRIILTAASKDKASWGCSPLDQNTFFIDALLGDGFDPSLSLAANFEQTKLRVAKREEEGKLAASEPQIFIGAKMRDMANQSLSEVLQHRAKATDANAKAAAKEAK